jgi:hypothetical protein
MDNFFLPTLQNKYRYKETYDSPGEFSDGLSKFEASIHFI